jgi:hypothetical protein
MESSRTYCAAPMYACANYLSTQDVAAQLIYEFATSYYPGTDLSSALRLLHAELLAFFRARRVYCGVRPFTKTTLSWKNAYDHPTLETQMKAANAKLVFLWAASKAVNIVNDGTDTSPHAALRASMAWSLAEAIRIFDDSGLFLKDEDAIAARDHGFNFLRAWQTLGAQSLARAECGYKASYSILGFALGLPRPP